MEKNLETTTARNRKIAMMAFEMLCDEKKTEAALRLARHMLEGTSISLGLGDIDWDIETVIEKCGGETRVRNGHTATFSFGSGAGMEEAGAGMKSGLALNYVVIKNDGVNVYGAEAGFNNIAEAVLYADNLAMEYKAFDTRDSDEVYNSARVAHFEVVSNHGGEWHTIHETRSFYND